LVTFILLIDPKWFWRDGTTDLSVTKKRFASKLKGPVVSIRCQATVLPKTGHWTRQYEL